MKTFTYKGKKYRWDFKKSPLYTPVMLLAIVGGIFCFCILGAAMCSCQPPM